MKKIAFLTLASLGLGFLAACTTSSPIPSVIYTGASTHLEDRMTGNQIGPGSIEKSGESCSWGVLFINAIYFGGGNSIEEAMKEGNIKKIGVIDHRSVNVLGPLFYKDCVVVWGE